MLTTTPQNKKRLIAAITVLIVLVLVTVYLAGRSLPSNIERSQVGSRYPASALTYCSMDPSHLCVFSFGQVVNGPMRVDLLAPNADYPEFVLKINNNGMESVYDCQSLEEAPENIYCTGTVQAPGATLQLSLLSKRDDALLAEGTFSVIGIALLTPEFVPDSTEEPIQGLTSHLGFRIPDAPKRSQPPVHPTPPHPTPSYPTPSSYPNPSYP